jgi:hypothetical protein
MVSFHARFLERIRSKLFKDEAELDLSCGTFVFSKEVEENEKSWLLLRDCLNGQTDNAVGPLAVDIKVSPGKEYMERLRQGEFDEALCAKPACDWVKNKDDWKLCRTEPASVASEVPAPAAPTTPAASGEHPKCPLVLTVGIVMAVLIVGGGLLLYAFACKPKNTDSDNESFAESDYDSVSGSDEEKSTGTK